MILHADSGATPRGTLYFYLSDNPCNTITIPTPEDNSPILSEYTKDSDFFHY